AERNGRAGVMGANARVLQVLSPRCNPHRSRLPGARRAGTVEMRGCAHSHRRCQRSPWLASRLTASSWAARAHPRGVIAMRDEYLELTDPERRAIEAIGRQLEREFSAAPGPQDAARGRGLALAVAAAPAKPRVAGLHVALAVGSGTLFA